MAQSVFSRAGGDPDKAGPLAEWAEEAKRVGDPKRGVIVSEDGELVAATRYVADVGIGASYVVDEDAKRLGLFGTEVGLASGQIAKQLGRRVIHVTMPEVTRGAGTHAPDLDGLLEDLRRVARARAAAEQVERQTALLAHTAGASPRQIADAIGVSHTTVHRWIKRAAASE